MECRFGRCSYESKNFDRSCCFKRHVYYKIENGGFNYNTLEPKILKANDLNKLNEVLGKAYNQANKMHRYMNLHKTECALKILKLAIKIIY